MLITFSSIWYKSVLLLAYAYSLRVSWEPFASDSFFYSGEVILFSYLEPWLNVITSLKFDEDF